MSEFKYGEYFNPNERGYAFSLVLYPDSTDYSTEFVLDKIQWFANFGSDMLWQYAYILHDKDEGKKPHYHICLKYKHQRLVSTVLRSLDLINYNPNGYDIVIRKWNKSLAYLIHANDKDKYQYNEDDVVSNIKETIDNIRHSKDRNDVFLAIADYINDWQPDSQISYKDVLEWVRCQDSKYLTVFLDRNTSYLIGTLIKERNAGVIYEKS